MTDKGFVKLPREILSHPAYKAAPATHKQVLITILEHMAYREQKVETRSIFEKYDPTFNQEITISAGQLFCSYNQLSRWSGIQRYEVRRAVKRFTSTHIPKRTGRPRKGSTHSGKILPQALPQAQSKVMPQALKPIFEKDLKYKKLLLTISWEENMQRQEMQEKEVDKEIHAPSSEISPAPSSDPTSAPDPYTTKKALKKNPKERNKQERKVADSEPLIAVRDMVLLTQREHEALLKRFGEADANAMLDILDSHNTKRDDHYKKDYGALKVGGWVYVELQKRKVKAEGTYGQAAQGFVKPGPESKLRGRIEITV